MVKIKYIPTTEDRIADLEEVESKLLGALEFLDDEDDIRISIEGLLEEVEATKKVYEGELAQEDRTEMAFANAAYERSL